jgi:hypothetical protein
MLLFALGWTVWNGFPRAGQMRGAPARAISHYLAGVVKMTADAWKFFRLQRSPL